MRRQRACVFCEECEDAGVRLITINEGLDTAKEDWPLNALFSAFKGEQSKPVSGCHDARAPCPF